MVVVVCACVLRRPRLFLFMINELRKKLVLITKRHTSFHPGQCATRMGLLRLLAVVYALGHDSRREELVNRLDAVLVETQAHCKRLKKLKIVLEFFLKPSVSANVRQHRRACCCP